MLNDDHKLYLTRQQTLLIIYVVGTFLSAIRLHIFRLQILLQVPESLRQSCVGLV